jgi:hypothetical protein
VGLILNSIKDDLLNSLTIFFILHFLKKESKEGVFGAGLKVSIEGEIYPKFYNDQRKEILNSTFYQKIKRAEADKLIEPVKRYDERRKKEVETSKIKISEEGLKQYEKMRQELSGFLTITQEILT